MTVALNGLDGVDDVVTLDDGPTPSPGTPAEWPARAGAFCVDVLLPAGLATVLTLTGLSGPDGGWLWWTCLVLAALVLLAMVVNRWAMPVLGGVSLGRSVFGCRVVDRGGSDVGPVRLVARDAAHVLDSLPLLLGWLWPLIDSRGRTFADLIARTEVHADDTLAQRRRVAGAVVAGVAGLATLVAALGFVVVTLHQRAVATTRAQIQNTGPELVADMLSYTAANVDADFEHDRALVTDGYRPELVKQQEAVRKAPVDNEYWVTNKAVLEAGRNTAAMLILLQGQRGVPPNQRLITASVRVSFERSGSGEWKISNLTVVVPEKVPTPPPGEKPAPPAPKKDAPPAPKPAPKPSPKPSPEPSGPGR